ncbi:MAG: GGDEF domain-containing protein, partial [Spirochaetaceae bacterium]|nr:GGDEF domain-containing protein [Spirochaetaceae bacterium]
GSVGLAFYPEDGSNSKDLVKLALAGFIAIALSNSNAHQSLVLANERIAYMATHDPMTGLPNRMRIMDRLEQELNRSRRYDKTLAVLFIDLDGFKRVNDTHGHQAGDFVLKQIAERLSAGIRATDAVGRLAGDEFLVIITDDCTRENGLQLAENLRKLLSEKIVFEKASLTVTGSVGLAFYPEDGSNSKDLVKLADKAMYKAKENGKNQIATQSSPL